MSVSTSILRIADILRTLRKVDETCDVASSLRTDIERQMDSAHASVEPAKDDTAVLDARKIAHKTP